jgi:hypothetical protein
VTSVRSLPNPPRPSARAQLSGQFSWRTDRGGFVFKVQNPALSPA